ncbi:MAG TPA: sensor histidine kinase [Gammaproteobacteria bacterium]|nr:sensor histidine kinase [Gammaproteobacteria bacterium]
MKRQIAALALAIHRRLLPAGAYSGVMLMPYFWLPYLAFLFIAWFYRPVSALELAGTLAAIAAFLVMYFRGFNARAELPWLIGGIAALGIAMTPFNVGGVTFFIYAGAFCAFSGPAWRGLLLLVVLITAVVVESLLLGRPVGQWIWAPMITAMVGLANFHFEQMTRKNLLIRQSREEIRRLAATAERERIARDLHDLLGHTLTLISVKAELAGRLAERDLTGAAREVRELEGIARDALAQVREAVGGYRAGGVAAELVSARLALQAAGVALKIELADVADTPEQDAVLAMIVREAVTNIVRHADASQCRMLLRRKGSALVLDVCDNGHGGRRDEGNGIRGMRERVQAVGGTLAVDFGPHGARLRVTVPTQPSSGCKVGEELEQTA